MKENGQGDGPGLLQRIVELSPKYSPPKHLGPLIEVLVDITVNGGSHKLVCSTPPRHGKTETLLHFIVWSLERHPDWTFAYCSYGQRIAYSKSRVAMQLARKAGIPLVSRNVAEWRTEDRGGCLAAGVGGPLTGQGVNVGIADDLVKNRLDAESAIRRDTLKEWFTSTFYSRIEPGGSCIVNMARWHPDDIAGRLLADQVGFDHINLRAITLVQVPDQLEPVEVALWPERWSLEFLKDKRLVGGEYDWASLYQGDPHARGGKVFETDPIHYDELPLQVTTAVGIDLSYTEKSTSDWSVIIRMVRYQELGWERPKFYVVSMRRFQKKATEFRAELQAELKLSGRLKMNVRWYCSGMEQAVADFVRRNPVTKAIDLPIDAIVVQTDKFQRAQRCAAAWNRGDILVPGRKLGDDSKPDVPWLSSFLSEVLNFTGVEDEHDDIVDAFTAAFDVLDTGLTATPKPRDPDRTRRRM